MRITLIGSGNVASVLGRLMLQSNHSIIKVFSQDKSHAKELADELGASYGDFTEKAPTNSELTLIAISDQGIEYLPTGIIPNNQLVLHTSGAVNMEILKRYSYNYGVLYPLQTLRKEIKTVPAIPFLIDGSSPEVLVEIEKFSATLSQNVAIANDEDRIKIHVAAVIVSNFTNYLYSIAEDFCIKEKLDFKLLIPLITETANRINAASPADVQTGPAYRKDISTLDKHLKILNKYPKLKTTYLRLTDNIMNP